MNKPLFRLKNALHQSAEQKKKKRAKGVIDLVLSQFDHGISEVRIWRTWL